MSARAIDPLRLEVATVVREHKIAEGQPAQVVDDLIDRVTAAAYDEMVRQSQEQVWF